MGKYLVTGATGNIGQYVVSELINLNKEVRAGVHNLERASETFKAANVSLIKFDFLDSSTYENALDGVEGIFLMRPPSLANPERDMLPFLQVAKKKGVKKIVFISLLGVEKNPVVPHRKIEKMLRELGVPYCFLRPSFFMQNLNTNHREEIKQRNELFIPAGKSKTSFIDTRDIGRVTCENLQNPLVIKVKHPEQWFLQLESINNDKRKLFLENAKKFYDSNSAKHNERKLNEGTEFTFILP